VILSASGVMWFNAPEWVTHFVKEGDIWSIIVLKELASGRCSHESCQGVQDGDAVCCCWMRTTYICGGDGMGAKCGVKGGPTMVGLGTATRACYCGRRCCM
jgi:hypothetical protein